GVGPDAAQLDDRRRAELRRQALEWLTAEYGAWAERHRLGKRGDRNIAATALLSWLKDQDLAGVRDEQSLARLPPDERRAWQALGERVAALAARGRVAVFARARAHAARLEWKEAAKRYAEGMELEPTDDGDLWFEYAATQLLDGDRPGYRRTCAHMLACGQATPPMRAYLVVRACTLAPDSTVDPAQLFLFYAKEVGNGREAWALTENAAWFFREGQPGFAVGSAESGLVADGRPGQAVLNWLWLALAYQKLGNPKEARRWLEKAACWLDQQGGRMPLNTTPYMGMNL